MFRARTHCYTRHIFNVLSMSITATLAVRILFEMLYLHVKMINHFHTGLLVAKLCAFVTQIKH